MIKIQDNTECLGNKFIEFINNHSLDTFIKKEYALDIIGTKYHEIVFHNRNILEKFFNDVIRTKGMIMFWNEWPESIVITVRPEYYDKMVPVLKLYSKEFEKLYPQVDIEIKHWN
jgi:hypothetical protein